MEIEPVQPHIITDSLFFYIQRDGRLTAEGMEIVGITYTDDFARVALGTGEEAYIPLKHWKLVQALKRWGDGVNISPEHPVLKPPYSWHHSQE